MQYPDGSRAGRCPKDAIINGQELCQTVGLVPMLMLYGQLYNFIKSMKKQSEVQCNPQQNRAKLIQQNLKLHREILLLEEKMSLVITMDISKAVETDKKKNESKVKFNEISLQEAYIRKLKARIKQLKALNLTDVANGIIAEENQLLVLKRELGKLAEEKAVLSQKCQDKKSALQYNDPLTEFKSETESELAKLRKKNSEMAASITELEREIRKYHRYQQLHKKFKDEKIVVENPQYEYARLDHEKLALVKKGKLVEQKWKPQLDGLDNQYFESKQTLLRKQQHLSDLEKELKNWQNRSSAVRNESEVLQDRDRLAKVVSLSPKKEKENSPAKETKKEELGVVDFFKNLFSKATEKDGQKGGKPMNASQQLGGQPRKQARKWENLAAQTRYGTKSQKIKQSQEFKYSFTKLSQKNEFMKSKHSFEEYPSNNKKKPEADPLQVKPNKIVSNSVAVGTSFYYNEDD